MNEKKLFLFIKYNVDILYRLYIFLQKKKRGENCKTSGLDPFSDNDDDIKRATRKFEQKYVSLSW